MHIAGHRAFVHALKERLRAMRRLGAKAIGAYETNKGH